MIKVYNTMTKQKEEFKPQQEGKVSIYCCGVTPYNAPHIGNARPFVTWDVIRRYLSDQGYEVKYIQNFTDVDDKIINTATAEKSDWKTVADRNIARYFAAMDALNVKRADLYPRVSENIDDITAMIKKLVDNGHAYAMPNGDVFFAVEKFADYGKLSGRSLEDMQAGARVEVDSRKSNPMDFALWKAAKPNEPAWDSPWGKGRPGWHIECSAMSLKYLGEKFDFHGGGSDLIFPHHENEIAQSQAYLEDNAAFAQYWLHNGFITIRNEKMSKSENNFFTVEEILEKYPGEILRFFILQTHYKSPLDFGEDRLKEAQAALNRLQTAKDNLNKLKTGAAKPTAKDAALVDVAADLAKKFNAAMDDDFNTALAISEMFALAKEINIFCQKATTTGEYDGESLRAAEEAFDKMAGIIGIFEQETKKAASDDTAEKLMQIIIDLRQKARADKNWALADEIRDKLKEAGFVLQDGKTGVTWKTL